MADPHGVAPVLTGAGEIKGIRMTGKKYSVTLEAKDALSRVFDSAGKAAERYKTAIGQTREQMQALERSQKLLGEYQGLQRSLAESTTRLAEARRAADAQGASLRIAAAEQRRYAKEINQAQAVIDALNRELQQNGTLTAAQSRAMAQAQQKIASLTPAHQKAAEAAAKHQRETHKLSGEAARLERSMDGQRQRLARLGGALKLSGSEANRLAAYQDRLQRATDKANHALQRQEQRLKTLNAASDKMQKNAERRGALSGDIMATVAAGAPLVALAKKSIDYEASFAGVKKVVDFKDKADEDATRRRMMKLASELGISQTGMTDIVAAAGEAGIGKKADGKTDSNELLAFAASAAKMGVAYDVSSGEAGEILATWRSAMGLTQDQAMQLADYTNQISNEMKARAKDVSAVMNRQGATAMGAGFTDKQSAGLAAAMLAGGATEETAATALKNISGALTKGFSATKSQREALAMIGFNPEQLAKDMQKDAAGTLFKVLDKLKKAKPEDQGAIISQIFGEEVKGAVAKLATNTTLLKKALDMAADSSAYLGSMQKEYDARAQTRAHRIAQVSAKIERISIALGDMLLPVVDDLLEPVAKLADAGAELMETSESARTTVSGLLKAGAALVGLKVGIVVLKGLGSLVSDIIQVGRIGKAKLGDMTSRTARSSERAARGLEAVNRQLDRMGKSHGASPLESIDGIHPRTKRRRKKRGLGKGLSLLGLGAGIASFSASADAADMLSTGADLADGAREVLDAGGPLMQRIGKFFKPLHYLLSGSSLASTVMTGDRQQIGRVAGDLAGSAAGGWAGASAGAALGTLILPGVGTAVGGALGGIGGSLLGGDLGSNIGEKLADSVVEAYQKVAESDILTSLSKRIASWFGGESQNKTDAAFKGDPTNTIVSKNQREARVDNKFEIKFDIKASGDPEQDNALAQKIQAQLSNLIPSLFSNSLSLDTRLDASLAGLGSD
ncbi:MAG: phage tail tape measure protein [Plesiomonas shigelloides]